MNFVINRLLGVNVGKTHLKGYLLPFRPVFWFGLGVTVFLNSISEFA